MEKIIIDQCRWRNAAAFIEVTPETGTTCVRGKFYDHGRGYPGPEVEVSDCPENLVKEILDLDGLYPHDRKEAMSEELKNFIFNAWRDGAAANPWFDY